MHKKQTDHGKNNRIVKNKMGEKFITKKKMKLVLHSRPYKI